MAEVPEIPEDMLGPKMRALRTDMQRRFAYIMGCGETSAAKGALAAGYTGPSAKVTASQMMQKSEILDAIHEVGQRSLRALGPVAIRRARAILENPKHPSHGRMIETVLDRTGYIATSKIQHEVSVDTSELEDLARRLAAESGIDPRKLLGTNVTLIEGEVVAVRDVEPVAK